MEHALPLPTAAFNELRAFFLRVYNVDILQGTAFEDPDEEDYYGTLAALAVLGYSAVVRWLSGTDPADFLRGLRAGFQPIDTAA